MNCTRAGCNGHIDADGFCTVCGLAASAAGTPSTGATAGIGTGAGTGASFYLSSSYGSGTGGGKRARRTGSSPPGGPVARGNLGAGIVDVPPVPYRDPGSVVLSDPQVPESKRFCSNPGCGKPVGRSRGGRAARLKAHCPACGRAYSFVPKLQPEDVVASRYQVIGCLAHGGLGWVYVARDRNLDDQPVVLKGLLNTGDASAMAAAIAERRFLIEVKHPNIVGIIDFAQHEGDSYIVMDYLGGRSLKDLRRDEDGQSRPLPVTVAIAYMIEALRALEYLHHRGLVYCDFKPDNIIHTEELLKIIDLGGVRRIDDDTSDIYGTVGYQAPEIGESTPTIQSDLYTVARTLAVLSFDFPGFQDPQRYAYSLPPDSEVPVLLRYPALRRFLIKGTHPDPAYRFESAKEMREQLLGVLRQVLAIDGKELEPTPSRLFSPDLGTDPAGADWRDLPIPLADPADPATVVLSALAASSPDQVMTALEAMPPSPEVAFQRARTMLEQGDVAGARRVLEDHVETDGADWRSSWWLGIIDLAGGKGDRAAAYFSEVASELPGELPPLLAMGLAHETAGENASAHRAYETVTLTDSSYVTATFGLSRILLGEGRHHDAVNTLRKIPSKSSSYAAAQAAIFAALTTAGQDAPDPSDLVAAGGTLNAVGGDPVKRAEMTRDLMLKALDLIEHRNDLPNDLQLGGVTLDEPSVRAALEQACRNLAKMVPSGSARIRLVDEANAHRSRTLW
jgi:serine/threonine-protein kinase PknG